VGFYPFTPASSGGITPPAGDIGGTTSAPTVVSTHLSAPLPVSQGGTGAATAALARAALGTVQYLYPSGVTSGVTDAAAINAALAALPADGIGIVRLAATAPWYIECGQVTGTTGQYIDATGCYIYGTGAGDVFRFVDTTNYATRTLVGGAGLLGNPVIDGTLTTGNSSPFHGGDILQLAFFYQANGFTAGTTSKGIWLDNNYWFTEQAYGRVYLKNCTAYAVFDNSANISGSATSSFARPEIDIYVAQQTENVQQDCLVFQNGAVPYDGGHIGLFGNVVTTTAANNAAVIRITGQGAGGSNTNFSSVLNTQLIVGVESDNVNANGPYTIFYGSGNNVIQECFGGMDFPFGVFQQSNLPGQECFVFTGPVNGDATLEQYAWSFQSMVAAPAGLQLSQFISATAVTANGQAIEVGQVTYIRLSAAAAFTGLILNNVGGLYGQLVVIVNESTFPQSFAVPATSGVANGFVIPAGAQQTYIYDHFTGLWYTTEPQPFTAALATTFTASATGTGAQNVTGLAAYLSVGTWKVKAYLPYQGATAAGTTHFGFTFSGVAGTGSAVSWKSILAATPFITPTTSATITTVSSASATLTTSPGPFFEAELTIAVTTAGTLQLQVYNGTSGDDTEVLGGASLEALQVA
jgi:hypothetical protein